MLDVNLAPLPKAEESETTRIDWVIEDTPKHKPLFHLLYHPIPLTSEVLCWLLPCNNDHEGGWCKEFGGSGAKHHEWSNESEYVQIVMLSGTQNQPSVITDVVSYHFKSTHCYLRPFLS